MESTSYIIIIRGGKAFFYKIQEMEKEYVNSTENDSLKDFFLDFLK